MSAADPILHVEGAASGYGQILAIEGIDLLVPRGAVASVVGANGAGKSTLLKTIAGLVRLRAGRITFEGEDLAGVPAHAMAARGIATVAEGGRLFAHMSVEENLELGAFHPEARRRRAATMDEVFALFPRLAERRRQMAGRLSGGERQMCAVGRALMGLPKLLMLDEPSLGLAPVMVEHLFETVRALVAARGLSVLLVEQNVADALDMAAVGSVIERGRIVKSGPGAALAADPDVQRAYMGV